MAARKKQSRPKQTRKKVPGRRPGRSNSRGAILDAARSRFARDGYEATTIRGVAADAGVDPSLVMQFYGSKEGLFLTMMEQAGGKSATLLAILTGPRAGLGGRLTRAYLEQWEDPVTGDNLRSLFRAAVGSPRASRLYKNAMAETLMKSDLPVPKRLPSLLAATQLLGTAIGRYLIELPGLVEPSLDELVRLITPAIDAYFDTD